jgi:hypothetical protein
VIESLLLLIATFFVFGSQSSRQKSIEPPDENASAEEVQKWLAGALRQVRFL